MELRLICLPLAAALLVSAAGAQVDWQRVPLLDGRIELAGAFDTLRMQGVAFGGQLAETGNTTDETLLWFGTRWLRAQPTIRPAARTRHAMVFDPLRGRVVLFGGRGPNPLADTWTWDGTGWQQQTPAASPTARQGHAMAWDGVRGVVLLHGGRDATNQVLDDTWQWNGTNWSQLVLSTSPSPRLRHAMAFDSARNVVVLWGGECYSPYYWCNLDDTWEWDGTSWTQRSPVHRPPSRWAHTLVYDPIHARMVMFGGGEEPLHTSLDTWEWDGTDWQQVAMFATSPPPRQGHVAFWDGTRVLVFAGAGSYSMSAGLSDTWGWNGVAWTEVAPSQMPEWRVDAAMAWSAVDDSTLLFRGDPTFADDHVWLFDGTEWNKVVPPNEPGLRHGHGLAPDPSSSGVVLFGGDDSSTWFDETWRWDGTTWVQLTPAVSPSPRSGHAMVLDSRRRCIVLFGGAHGWSRRLNDTWTFDGTTWRELKSASQPAPRTRPAMVFDAARRQVLMFGGQGGSGALDDTWVLLRDGWVLRMPANRPPAGSHAIAFDAVRQRVVIRVATGGTWEWDGFDWTQRAPATAPPSTVFDTIASWDPLRARVVLYTPESGTWLYGAEPPAAVETFGHSCGGAGGIPTLASQSGYGPTLGERFTLMASSLPTHPLAVLELGASRTWWGGQALPLDLGLLGMTGCALFVSLDLEARATVANGAAVWPLRIPDMPAVLGATLYGQVVAHDPTANTPGLVWSDALSATVGGR